MTGVRLPPEIRLDGNPGGREFLEVDHPAVRARIALQGAQIIECVPAGQGPLLWMSPIDPARPDTALRGGIPLCWPWFADERAGPAHGIARTSPWQLRRAESDPQGVRLLLELPEEQIHRQLPGEYWAVHVEFVLGDSLSVTLTSTNTGTRTQKLSQALHAYLPVDDIHQARITGLEGVAYIDKVQRGAVHYQQEPIEFTTETDRVYFDTSGEVVLSDGSGEALCVQRAGSQSVVVWNPWLDKAKRLSQFPPDGYRHMVCIEAANAGPDGRLIEPGQSHALSTRIRRDAAAP